MLSLVEIDSLVLEKKSVGKVKSLQRYGRTDGKTGRPDKEDQISSGVLKMGMIITLYVFYSKSFFYWLHFYFIFPCVSVVYNYRSVNCSGNGHVIIPISSIPHRVKHLEPF